MSRNKATALVLIVFSLVLFLSACEAEHTAPERVKPDPVDPIDWDGTKESPRVSQALSDAPSRDWPSSGLDAHQHALGTDLRPHDHTIIMEAILRNAPAIAARLPQNQVSSEVDVLEAATMIPEVSPYVKGRIRMVLDMLRLLQHAQPLIPEEMQEVMSEIREEIAVCEGPSEAVETLQGMIASGRYRAYEGLPEGLTAGIDILRDGEKTVYTPRCLFNLKRMIQQDLAGAIAGAIAGGVVAGPPGAAVGALAGAAGSSASDAIGQLTGWW